MTDLSFQTTAALLCLLMAPAAVLAQSRLPVNSPTSQLPSAAIGPLAGVPSVTHGRHAYVSYDDGLLHVRADNSSLNVILRDIARVTGMTIIGGVADQRVFGSYGPANPGAVMATLLDGTGVNMLMRSTADGTPASLVLTAQTGGITPPGPDSPQFDGEASVEALATPAVSQLPPANTAVSSSPGTTTPSVPAPANNPLGSSTNTTPTASEIPTAHSVGLDSIPTPSTTPASSGIVDSANPPPVGTTVNPVPAATLPASPNGVKTPEQIYQQLLALQKAKQAAAGGASPTQ